MPKIAWLGIGVAIGWAARCEPQGGQEHAESRAAQRAAQRALAMSNSAAQMVEEERNRAAHQ